MKRQRVLAVAKKEFLHILRDLRSLLLALAIPAMLLFMYGYALTFDISNIKTIVWDKSQTPSSRNMISRLEGSRYFSVHSYASNYADIEHAIDKGEATVALIIPVEPKAEVQLIIDGSDANTATLVMGYAEAILAGEPPTINLRMRIWYNEELASRNNIVPSLIAVIMTVIAALLTSLTIAREWERGTMEQLIATPVTSGEVILGKFLPYLMIGMVDVIFAILMGEFLFEVPFRGNFFLLFTVIVIFLLGALSLGILISITIKEQLIANQVAIVATLLPSMLLSGFFAPIANMPYFLQYVTYIVPARYVVTILRDIYLKGVGLAALWGEITLLLLFGIAMYSLAVNKFKKKLE